MTEEITEEIVETPAEPTEEQLAAQEEAKKYGWRPKEEFDYDPQNWVDADRFLELPSTQNKMLRDEIRDLKEQNAKSDETFAERLERMDKANKAAMEAALAQQKRDHEAQVADLSKRQEAAVESADIDEYRRLETQKAALKPPEPIEPEPEKPQANPAIEAYKKANEWAQDPIMWQFAVQATQTQENANKPIEELLTIAETAAKTYFPHRFEEPKPKTTRVDGGGLAGGAKPSGKGAADLPAEARQAGTEFVEMGIFKSLDDYAKTYFEEAS